MSHNAVSTLRRREHVSKQLSCCSTLLRLLLRALGALLRSSSPRAQMSMNVDLLLCTPSPSTEETCSTKEQTHVLFCIIDVKQQNKNSKHLHIFNDLKKSHKILFVVPVQITPKVPTKTLSVRNKHQMHYYNFIPVSSY